MPDLATLATRGLVRDGYAYSAHVGADGIAHRVDFDGDWHGLNGAGNALDGDRWVDLGRFPVRVVRIHCGERIASEDIPALLTHIARCA